MFGGHVGVPPDRSGARVEADDVRIDRVEENQVLVDGQAAHLCGRAQPLVHFTAVFPDEVAGGGVERLHDVAGVGDVHHAVTDDRHRLRDAWLEAPGPGELHVADIVPVDLVERTVAPAVEGAPPVEPVARIRVLEYGIADRPDVGRLLRHAGRSCRDQRRPDQQGKAEG